MTTGTLLEVEGEVSTNSLLVWPFEKTYPEERGGSFLATSQTPSELKLEHLQERQVAEGASRPQSPEFVTARSALVQVASGVQAVQWRVHPPATRPIRPDIAREAGPFQEGQGAEGASSPRLLPSGTDTSPQGQVASDVDVVPQRVQPPVVPPIRLQQKDIAPEARPYLNGDMEKLAGVLRTLIEVESARSWMPVEKLEIGLKRSYEEDWIEVVFRVYVKANAAQALAFWHAIGSAIDRWRPTLAPLPQRLLDEQVAVFVEW